MENHHIRPFQPDDLPRLHEIREAAFAPIFQSFRDIIGPEIALIALANAEQEQADYLDGICKPDSAHEVFVIERNTEIIAFCSASLDHKTSLGTLDLNAVHPDHQGNGLGTWMYAFILEHMRAAGMRAAAVGTGGDPSHAPARRAYEKAGFGPFIPSHYYYREL